MTFKDVAAKKVIGIPVLYLAAAAVIILAVVAWRMKSSPDSTAADALTGQQNDAELDENGLAVPGSDPYAGLASSGTVTVVQQPTNTTPEVEEIVSNDQWARKAAEWLTATHNVPGADAMAALTKFLEGQDRSFEEQQWVNMAIAEKGQPPQAVTSGGTLGRKDVVKATVPGYHTVQSTDDDTVADLIKLYYNNTSDDSADLIQAANVPLGNGPWPIGTKVMIPAYHAPVYYTVSAKSETAKSIAAKNGITLEQLAVLNDPKGQWYSPVYTIGRYSRVRIK